MIPIVEWNLSTETSNFSGEERTTGTINPGAIYVADKFQLAVEAIIPVTGQAATTSASWDNCTSISMTSFLIQSASRCSDQPRQRKE